MVGRLVLLVWVVVVCGTLRRGCELKVRGVALSLKVRRIESLKV